MHQSDTVIVILLHTTVVSSMNNRATISRAASNNFMQASYTAMQTAILVVKAVITMQQKRADPK